MWRLFFALVIAAQPVPFPGAPVVDELKPGETKTYLMHIEKGLFFLVTAAQLSGNVALRVRGPGGAEIASQNRLEAFGVEDLPWIAPETGSYSIDVRSVPDSAARYRLEAVARTAAEKERSHVAAFRLGFIEAEPLLARKTAAMTKQLAAKYEAAAIEANKAGAVSMEASILKSASVVAETLGDLRKARELSERSVALYETVPGDPQSQISALSGYGKYKTRTGEPKAAIPILERAVAMSRAIPNAALEATALSNLGAAYEALSDNATAMRYGEEALRASRAAGEKKEIGLALSNLGTKYYNRGDKQKALEYHLEGLQFRREAGDERVIGISLRTIGSIYSSIGDAVKAGEYLQQAEAIYRRLGDERNLGAVLQAMGSSKMTQTDAPGAIGYLEQAVVLQRKTGDTVGLASSLGLLADMYMNTEQWVKAKTTGAEALSLASGAGSKSRRTRPLGVLARAAVQEGKFSEAEKYFEEAITISREIADTSGEARFLDDRSTYLRQRGRLQAALVDIEKSMAIGLAAAEKLTSAETRASARALLARRSRRHVDLLMALHALDPAAGYADRAFLVAERDRARTLREFLADGAKPAAPSAREKELTAAVTAAQTEYFREGLAPARRAVLQSALAKAERELDLVRHTAAGERRPAVVEEWDIARVQSELAGEDGAVIVFTPGGGKSLAWAITRDAVRHYELPDKQELAKPVESLRKLLATPANALTAARTIAAIDAEARALTKMLIAPMAGAIGGKKRLVIVPDGLLAYLPFEVLGLIETHRISYAPSVSIAGALRKKAAPRELAVLALGDPSLSTAAISANRERGFAFTPLPSARAEVAAIGKLFPSTKQYVGEAASEDAVKGQPLERFRYLHFAAHGYFDGERPERSGIVLAQKSGAAEDGFLQAREIAQLTLDADLVTLSACQSGLGKVLDGEGVQGLSRAFFLAGARSVVVSLWNVNDAATSELMRRFYAGLKSGLVKDDALRAAKLAVMKEPRWRHPYYWAPFVLQGDAGGR